MSEVINVTIDTDDPYIVSLFVDAINDMGDEIVRDKDGLPHQLKILMHNNTGFVCDYVSICSW